LAGTKGEGSKDFRFPDKTGAGCRPNLLPSEGYQLTQGVSKMSATAWGVLQAANPLANQQIL